MGLKARASSAPKGPDVDSIDAGELTERAVDHLPGEGFRILMNPHALRAVLAHTQSITDKEICGVLIGNVWRDAAGPYLHVRAAIRGEHASHQAAQVTFTSQTWTYINQVLDCQYPDERIVGWYHTHPGFGVFLSDMDLFIHQGFFDMPWQVAMVFDPLRNEEAVFVWRKGKCELFNYTLDEDRPEDALPDPALAFPSEEKPADAAPAAGPSIAPKRRDSLKILRVLRRYAQRSFGRMHFR